MASRIRSATNHVTTQQAAPRDTLAAAPDATDCLDATLYQGSRSPRTRPEAESQFRIGAPSDQLGLHAGAATMNCTPSIGSALEKAYLSRTISLSPDTSLVWTPVAVIAVKDARSV